MTQNMLSSLAERTEALGTKVSTATVVMGFDAFVDESLRIVGGRTSPESYQPIPTIGDFGAWASAAAGRSGSREFVCEDVVAGGCSVNCGDGIASMGFQLRSFAGVGSPAHAAFEGFAKKCAAVESLGMEPGRALVTEFDDGKLMFCSFSHFAKFKPDYLRVQMANGCFRSICKQAQGIALTSWSVYPYMTDCWKYLIEEELAGISQRPHLFFDLADPASRSPQDIVAMIEMLGRFEEIGRVSLSLNGNEANRLASALGIPTADESASEQERLCVALRERASISEASIHLVKGASLATTDTVATVEGPVCRKPKKSVGAGDRFNAGYLAGLILDLSPAERLALGAASSGFFVRHARSASWGELTAFIRKWGEGALDKQNPSTELNHEISR
ncbi:PfkB family carbohydrate kinase [Pelagicoccus sp. SDUM812003]|uniref:PfkB family carbohydrate kinase n=1 Tax=Pelagicoccus sp. SDUM812003 TaxID=3041267 RepID=UPI00280CBB25|nr:PfkB family carbohydrate kinase [Pelagicoccus sp. SDUM812003]MDQ8201442.1 PfkB family carbohydrate kinase [Pelagicoccus sp. SDUM812003]